MKTPGLNVPDEPYRHVSLVKRQNPLDNQPEHVYNHKVVMNTEKLKLTTYAT